MMLAGLGADVIKIESPFGDDTRAWMPPVDASGRGTYFASNNRNKRSIVCNLRMPEGMALIDVFTGQNAVVGIQAALRVSESTGGANPSR